MEQTTAKDIFNTIDEAYDSEESVNEVEEGGDEKSKKRHKRLLKDISTITGVPSKRAALRSEPSAEIDEHLWSQKNDGTSKVKLNDLLKSVPQTSSLGSLKKKIAKLEKTNSVLDTPLSKPQKEKIQRSIAYTENKKEISKWEPKVLKNRQAENLTFPLNAYKPQEFTTKSVAANFKPRGSLEQEIAAVLKGSASMLERRNKELTESEEKALQAVDLEEAIARRKELQKLRALQSYYEIKCKRQKKIKSKKFRRIHRKSEQKRKEKVAKEATVEEKERLTEEVEKNRVLERAHLRHRNTSKWAKKMISKDNKSAEEKQLLHDQLRVSRQLTEQKIYEPESDEEPVPDANDGLALLQKTSENDNNPWLLGQESKPSKDATEVTLKLREDDSSDNSDDESGSEEEKQSDDEWNEAGKVKPSSDIDEAKNLDETTSSSKNKQHDNLKQDSDSDSENNDDNDEDIDTTEDQKLKISRYKKMEGSKKSLNVGMISKKEKPNITHDMNPDNFLKVESKALDVEVLITDNSEIDFAKSKEQLLNVREAFANDDIMEEFEIEKKKEEEKRTPKEIDLALPGWGEWAGAAMDNEKILNRKRKKFTKKAKKPPSSKDRGLKHVILSEGKNSKFSTNQVHSLPFPFKDKSHFEQNIRQPLGKTWNTPSMSAKLTQPRISTLIGTIIDPIKKTKAISKVSNSDKNAEFIAKKNKNKRQ